MTRSREQRDVVARQRALRIDARPAESMNHTIGMRQRRASSRMRLTLTSPVWPIEPPLTVKS